MASIRVTQIKSGIGKPKDQRATLKGLGLTRMNRSRVLDHEYGPAARSDRLERRDLGNRIGNTLRPR